MLINTFVSAAMLPIIVLFVTATHAATPAEKCEMNKLTQSARYSMCRLKADAKAVKKGLPPDYTKCEEIFAKKWSVIEAKPGAAECPSRGDESSMNARVTGDAAEIATLLAGGTVSECGNGLVEAGEDCDFGDLNGGSCIDEGFGGGGVLSCGAGCVYNAEQCVAAVCGNGLIEEGEECDGGNFGGLTCLDFGFTSDETPLECFECAIETDLCQNLPVRRQKNLDHLGL